MYAWSRAAAIGTLARLWLRNAISTGTNSVALGAGSTNGSIANGACRKRC